MRNHFADEDRCQQWKGLDLGLQTTASSWCAASPRSGRPRGRSAAAFHRRPMSPAPGAMPVLKVDADLYDCNLVRCESQES